MAIRQIDEAVQGYQRIVDQATAEYETLIKQAEIELVTTLNALEKSVPPIDGDTVTMSKANLDVLNTQLEKVERFVEAHPDLK
jgi:hypothetical protein